jgi:hypothetical protein
MKLRASRLPKADLKNTEVKGTEHEHNFTYYPYTVACRRSTDMALQQRMGLLSEWRRRIDRPDNRYSGVNGKAVADMACSAILNQKGSIAAPRSSPLSKP